jgi:DNA-nicking Smr family endonuclease
MARQKTLTSEDRILWGKVARSTKALPGRMEDLLEPEPALEPVKETRPKKPDFTPKNPVPDFDIGSYIPGLSQVAKIHHPLEKPVKRKLARGHLALEARIDLHGLVQSEAHAFLHSFLTRAHERGLRHVLVITGKGSSMGSDGALKRAVPMWFSKPDFRHLISSYETASIGHGGDGALYVRLAGAKHSRSRTQRTGEENR